jgi:hypothetical protein
LEKFLPYLMADEAQRYNEADYLSFESKRKKILPLPQTHTSTHH